MEAEVNAKLYEARIKELLNDLESLRLYGKGSCRHCYGKGYITRQINNGLVWEEKKEICRCVVKALQKEIKEIGQDD